MTFLLFFLLFLSATAQAQNVDRDSFEVGVEAFNAGNCDEALRIMKKYEKEQPSAAYVVRICELMSKKKEQKVVSYTQELQELVKGNLAVFDKIALIDRFNEQISGFSGAMYVHNLKSQADSNNPNAAFRMGLLYQEGIGVKRNFAMAAKYFQKAAEQNHTGAINSLGVYHRFGIGVKKDEKKAEELLKKAVLASHFYAFYNLAQMYADKKDFLQSVLLAKLGMDRIDREKAKKNYLRFETLFKESQKNLSEFHKAYLEKFRPYWIKSILPPKELQQFHVPEALPLPPEKMIEETPFMKFIKKDAFDNRYKTFFPFMPSWVGMNDAQDRLTDPDTKELPAPTPQDQDAIAALYFRPADPRFIHLTLQNEYSAIPVMVGDVLMLSVYTPLYENNATRKGGHMYIKNTGYTVSVQDPNGLIAGSSSFILTPLSPQTARQESWLSRRFSITKEGTAIIRFIPQPVPDGKKIVPHTLKIVATKGKPPK